MLTLESVGMGVGAVGAGCLLQSKYLNKYTLMGTGALLVAAGLFLTFPLVCWVSFYNAAPLTAFPGVFLAGIGDPLATLTALRAMYDIQVRVILFML